MSIYLELAGDPQIVAGRSFFGSKPYTLDQKRLMEKVDCILRRYDLSPMLLDDETQKPEEAIKPRCQHAFAAGAIRGPTTGGRKYDIFRAYRTEKTSGKFYHPGPDPATCKVSSICAATGATKYLLEPHTIGSTTYSDNGFPNPHNITDLAMDEAYHIYGPKAPLSVIVNVGPGIPSDNDILKLQVLGRTFSWPSWLPINTRVRLSPKSSPSSSPTSSTKSSTELKDVVSPPRSDTSSSASSEAEEVERQIEAAIKERLQRDYHDEGIFMRLAPPPARDELALNDVDVISASSEEADRFLEKEETKDRLKEAARRYCINPTAA